MYTKTIEEIVQDLEDAKLRIDKLEETIRRQQEMNELQTKINLSTIEQLKSVWDTMSKMPGYYEATS